MNAADRQRIYVDGLKAKIHLLEQSVTTQKAELERRERAISALEQQQRALILGTHVKDAEIARIRAELDVANARVAQEYDERVSAEARARSLGRRIKAARERLAGVYAHYNADEVARAGPTSQLGMWRDGMKELEE